MSENKSLFVWNNRSYSATELVDLQEVPEHIATVQSALRFCLSQDSEWTLQTSGSTGAPKTLALSRAMIYGSARATLDAFELVPGSTAALVLPAKYIGGFMMVVRAFIGQLTLHLCEPRALPEVPEGLDFVSMTPAQFIALQEAGKPLKVKTLLLGGSALASRFDSASYQGVYLGYGMTETASHVALRPLGSPIYTAVGSTGFSVNTDECLCISAPHLGIAQLQTQDRVRLLDKKRFHYEGRLDHVINSGGIKLHPEKFESVCDAHSIQAVMSAKGHERYGQVPVMVLRTMDDVKGLRKALRLWDGTAMPKEACIVPEWPLLENGKLDRLKLQTFIKSHPDCLFRL
jgi:O-succinylbenzoic acid--CoA ligase|tara:strand:- start:3847 stop:4884 length:1038 start_codon:yes stop_codon:yes gene_type:complete